MKLNRPGSSGASAAEASGAKTEIAPVKNFSVEPAIVLPLALAAKKR
ncbi:MAG: hypothetical protein AAF492_33580 [Verrucomicrobiota bacterium]